MKTYDFTVKTKAEIQADIDLLLNTFSLFLEGINCEIKEIVNHNICLQDYNIKFKIPSHNTSISIKLSDFYTSIKEDENHFYFDLSNLVRLDYYKREQNIFSEKYNNFIQRTFSTLNKLKIVNNTYIMSPKFVIDKNKSLNSYIETGMSVKPYESNLIPENLKEIDGTKRINRIRVNCKLTMDELHKISDIDSEFDFLEKIFENDYLFECITKEIPFGDVSIKDFLKEILCYRKLVDY